MLKPKIARIVQNLVVDVAGGLGTGATEDIQTGP